ncbi:AEC family transporter [Mycetohabitans sp. B5]|uniref:AEC family transporter n=1 Tax=Mycetohabitans endofungorum TaxID=417203 RepID=A0A2P5K849_9BURK|nr:MULTISPECIES: AEC family transporter [Mycetohabitans]MCG1055370.1 AEC family transporter [Mycetohabitans sp. B5]PPB82908.1 hypothetical protein B0O95_11285 [Mycetohabitans endofungorum]
MLSTLGILLPVFALIFAGFVCRRRALLGPTAASELNRFVVRLALPALLFDITAHSDWAQLTNPALVATFSVSCTAVFAIVLAARLMAGRQLADASVDAIAASYPNTGYLGFPLVLLAFGHAGLAPTTIATVIVTCVLFTFAIVLIEIGVQNERAPRKLAAKVAWSLVKNPLTMAPVVGALVSGAAIALPPGLTAFTKLLGGAASPCALVSLGLFLAEPRPATGATRSALVFTGVKLLVQPMLAWWLAVHVFALATPLADVAVLLAALPTGTGPYMLAEFYRREAAVTAQTILLSTMGSLVSLSLLLYWMRAPGG